MITTVQFIFTMLACYITAEIVGLNFPFLGGISTLTLHDNELVILQKEKQLTIDDLISMMSNTSCDIKLIYELFFPIPYKLVVVVIAVI